AVVEELRQNALGRPGRGGAKGRDAPADGKEVAALPMAAAAPGGPGGGQGAALRAPGLFDEAGKDTGLAKKGGGARRPRGGATPEPTVRKNFADTAYWASSITTDKDGTAEVRFKMPENLTGWKVRVWGMGHGTKVGQGEAEVTTKKDLLVRLQAPRFFTQKDEVVLSANVHNYLKTAKSVQVTLQSEGGVLQLVDKATQTARVGPGGDKRVDWKVKVLAEGQAIVRVKAVTDEEADAMEMRFPAYVHGMLKMDSFTGVLRPDKTVSKVTMTVPAERRVKESRLEVRFSPTLAGAMVDALPYMVDYPYGCTEQTLNRFLPTVITQNTL